MGNSEKVRTAFAWWLLALSIPTATAGTDHKPVWMLEGLDQPESVLALENEGLLLISNINGAPMELNGKGYITRATSNGAIISKKWLEGLDAPKGMAAYQGKLYIADMQTLHVVDIASAEIVQQYQAPNAGMLNDVTVSDSGDIYVSDFIGGGIYRLQGDSFDLWLRDPHLPHPNALLWDESGILIGGWGRGMRDDFTTEVAGTLYRVDPKTKKLSAVPEGFLLGNIDGVVKVGRDLYVSDWISGDLYRLGGNERVKALQLDVGLADIGSAPGVIYAPMMMQGRVAAWKMPTSGR